MGAGNWQDAAWQFLEHVGELEYYVSWRAASASRCRLVASALDDQGAPTGMIPDDDPNAEKVRRIVWDIAGGVSGQIKIMHRASYLLTVVGECWLGMIVRDASRETAIDGNELPVNIGRDGYQLEQWYVFGKEDIKASSNRIELKLPDGTKHEFNPNVDVLFRVWDEHPKDPSKAISPVWSNRDVLAAIVQSAATVAQANNSRLIGNGVWMVPQEMSLPDQVAPAALPVGDTDDVEPEPFFEPNAAQKLQDLLADVASAAKRDPNSQAAMLPIIAAVPGEFIKAAKDGFIRPITDVPETTLKIEEFDIRRLATGLHVAPERLLGMSEGNHWTGWLIDESDVKVHIAPVVEIIISALTQEILRYKLVQEGIDPNQYIVWYDASSLTQDPDKTDEAVNAFDRGALTAKALREHLGFDDEDGYDLTNADGWIQLALDKVAQDPANAGVFGEIIKVAAAKVGLEVSAPQQALPPGEGDQDESEESPADAEPEQPEDDPSKDESVQAAAITVARLCVNRALELANKRRRTRAEASAYRDISIELAHTRLDPLPLGEATDLIRGWAVGLSDADLRALGLDPEPFRWMVEGAAVLALSTASPPLITQNMLRRAG